MTTQPIDQLESSTPTLVESGQTDDAEPPGRRNRILVVDDDEVICSLVRDGLEREGFDVRGVGDGTRALRELAKNAPDLMVLDVNLPTVCGFDVLTAIRRTSQVPVILLTGRGDELDRVLGLELGADDYVIKPFSPRELASRARAILRRAVREAEHELDFGVLRVDTRSREVRVRGALIDLTAREFDLLAFLASSPRRVFSHRELLASVWQSSTEWQDPATVTEYVRRVRSKIEDDRARPQWIRTVRSVGYAFHP